jgi:hypothetical protein
VARVKRSIREVAGRYGRGSDGGEEG